MDVTVGLARADAGALLVDTGTTLSEAAVIEADVRAITNSPVTRIVLTHKHFDHVLGSAGFPRAEIYCAPQVAEYMSAPAAKLRADALRHGAGAAEVDRAIAALHRPGHMVYDTGSRRCRGRGVRPRAASTYRHCDETQSGNVI